MNTPEKGSEKGSEKSIEMRLAAIEDKLSQMDVSDEEMKAYQKVSALLGGGGSVQYQPDPNSPIIPRFRYINRGIIPRINRGICECYECQCGPCGQWGGGFGGGGFGSFGS